MDTSYTTDEFSNYLVEKRGLYLSKSPSNDRSNTFQILGLKVLCFWVLLSPGQTEVVDHSCLIRVYHRGYGVVSEIIRTATFGQDPDLAPSNHIRKCINQGSLKEQT